MSTISLFMLFQRLETMNPSASRHPSDTLRGVRIEGCFNLGGVECAGEGLVALGVDLVLEHGGFLSLSSVRERVHVTSR